MNTLNGLQEKTYNKLFNKDKKQLAFAPSSLILANNFLPVNRALGFFVSIQCYRFMTYIWFVYIYPHNIKSKLLSFVTNNVSPNQSSS